jgi:hypothetical protein
MLTYLKTKGIIVSILLFSISFAQDADTTAVEEEESGKEMYTSVDISYSQDKGNTDFLSLYYGFNYTLIGDLGPFKDTEFLFDFNRSDDELDGESFTDDQALTLKFDVWANQRFSPFLFFQKSFDNVIGLEDRLNYGLGAKVGLPFGLSVSYAFLFEKEDYKFWTYTDSTSAMAAGDYYYTDSTALDPSDYYGWDYDYGWWYYYADTVHFDDNDTIFYAYTDSTVFYYDDSTEAPAEEFFRHSIRPKIKVKLFDNNLVLDYRFYYKPRMDDFDDYLLEHELKVSLATFYEALTIDLNYTNKYNSRYDGTKLINPETGIPYKSKDENITFGLSFMF